jgi:hypothetical protein
VKKLTIFILAALLSTAAFALPNGQPFKALEGMIDMLAGDVGDLEGRVTALENQLALLSLDVVTNADAIAAIDDELDLINGMLAQKQDILNGVCPAGEVIQTFDGQGNLVCLATGNTVNRLIAFKQAFISPNAVKTTSATCPPGSVAVGGSASYIGGIRSTTITGNQYRAVNNPAAFFAIAIVTVVCLDID